MKKAYLVAVGFIVLGLLIAGRAMIQSLVPYVSVAQARESTRKVQVKGQLVQGTVRIDHTRMQTLFVIEDEKGDRLPVVHPKIAQGNIEEATEVVAIGQMQGDAFVAEKILYKCPSKYQGKQMQEYQESAQ
ncbi:MAG: cytochrome c maturation protein CcmE [Armatimonadota bacterium]|nr:cytochrome c maturation protein CcmE [Armatimonadota bacterium]